MTGAKVPICQCGRLMDCEQQGLFVLTHDVNGQAHELWSAAVYRCPVDHCEVLLMLGDRPVSAHWQPSFSNTVARLGKLTRAAYYGNKPLDAQSATAQNAAHHEPEETPAVTTARTARRPAETLPD